MRNEYALELFKDKKQKKQLSKDYFSINRNLLNYKLIIEYFLI